LEGREKLLPSLKEWRGGLPRATPPPKEGSDRIFLRLREKKKEQIPLAGETDPGSGGRKERAF